MEKAQFQFAWIFAVIVGALILFLAFYFVGTTLLRQRYEQETVKAQSLDILLNPFTYLGSLGATTYNPLSLPEESEIMMGCNAAQGELGYNEITLISEKGAGIPKTVYDKYIFAPQPLKAKNLEALSMPFEMPWRVADIIILWPLDQKYCFVRAPTKIKNEIEKLEIESIKIEECKGDEIEVCFSSFSGSCNVRVYDDRVSKNGRESYYGGDALMYAAIFSDPVLYECNVKRLASRIYSETEIYEKKALALNQRGCDVAYNLEPLKKAAENVFEEPNRINELEQASQTLRNINRMSSCTLF